MASLRFAYRGKGVCYLCTVVQALYALHWVDCWGCSGCDVSLNSSCQKEYVNASGEDLQECKKDMKYSIYYDPHTLYPSPQPNSTLFNTGSHYIRFDF